MPGFEDALKDRLERNARLAEEREHAEQEMDEAAERARQQAEEEARRLRAQQDARHAALAERLEELLEQVRVAAPEVDVRGGWSASGEEVLARIAAPTSSPKRSLLIELDRDDDEVLARWHSDVGESLEMWRLLEFDTEQLDELVLQVVDDELWAGLQRPPAFPGGGGA